MIERDDGRDRTTGPESSTAFEDAPVALLVARADGRVVTVNRAWCSLTGLTSDASAGDGWLTVLDTGDRRRVLESIEEAASTGVIGSLELEPRVRTSRRWTRWVLAPGHDRTGVVVAVVDVAADRARRHELELQASRDPLTGLVNRGAFLAFTGLALRRMERHPGQIAVLFIDLDGFRAVNDTFGHLLGDRVLAAAAGRIHDSVRPEDVVARVGGDEFAVLCEDLDSVDPTMLARRVRNAFTAPLAVDGGRWPITASVGVASSDRPDLAPESLLGAADEAMYHDKRHPQSLHGRAVVARKRIGHHDRPEAAGRAGPDVTPSVADGLINDLFAVGLTLASCASLVDGPASSRLVMATEGLDRVIQDLRRVVLEEVVRQEAESNDVGCGWPGPDGDSTAGDRVRPPVKPDRFRRSRALLGGSESARHSTSVSPEAAASVDGDDDGDDRLLGS